MISRHRERAGGRERWMEGGREDGGREGEREMDGGREGGWREGEMEEGDREGRSDGEMDEEKEGEGWREGGRMEGRREGGREGDGEGGSDGEMDGEKEGEGWMKGGSLCMLSVDIPKQANPDAEEASPAAVGKLFSEHICKCRCFCISSSLNIFEELQANFRTMKKKCMTR